MALDFNAFQMGQQAVGDPIAETMQRQQGMLQLQAGQQALQAHQEALQRQHTFGQDMQSFLTNPSAKGVASLFGKYPEFNKQISDSWNTIDESQRRSDATQLGSVASLISKGDFDNAAQIVQTRIDADKAAGRDSSSDEHALSMLKSGDPKQQKAVLGLATIEAAGAVGPDKAGEFLKSLGLSQEPISLSNESRLVTPQGDTIVAADPKPDFLVVPEGGKAIPLNASARAAGGGGGQTSPGAVATAAPGAVARTHGYTPRERDGGDNPNNVVDNKIAALATAVGVDPDTPMNPQQFAAFTRVLPGTENAAGNNPGGIKDGEFAKSQPGYAGAHGEYAIFNNPQAGAAAMRKLLQTRFYNRGQQSIRDIIEGRPLASGAQPTHPNAAAQPGDIPGTVYGNQKPQARTLTPAETAKLGLDTAKVYERHPDGTVSAVGEADNTDMLKQYGITPEMTGPDVVARLPGNIASQVKAMAEGRLPMPSSFALAKPYWQRMLQLTAQYDPTFDAATAPARKAAILAFTGMGKGAQLVGSINRVANHLQTLWNASNELAGPDTGVGPLNSVLATAGQAFEPNQAKAYDTAVGFVSGELGKIAKAGLVTEGETNRIISSLGRRNSLATRQSAIKTAVDIISGAFDPLKSQYESAFTNESARPNIPWVSKKAQNVFRQIDGSDLSLDSADANLSAPAHASTSGPVHVASPGDAAKLPSGTLFITPDGRTMRKR